MEVSGQHHAPAALLPRRNGSARRIGSWMNPQNRSDNYNNILILKGTVVWKSLNYDGTQEAGICELTFHFQRLSGSQELIYAFHKTPTIVELNFIKVYPWEDGKVQCHLNRDSPLKLGQFNPFLFRVTYFDIIFCIFQVAALQGVSPVTFFFTHPLPPPRHLSYMPTSRQLPRFRYYDNTRQLWYT